MDILFVTSTRIGDAVLSTGLLSALVERYPAARFTVAAGAPAAPLFRAVPRLARLLVIEKRRGGGHWFDLWRATIGTAWRLVVDLRGSLLGYLLLARQRRVLLPPAEGEHRLAGIGRLLGLDPPPAPRLFDTPDDEAAAAALAPRGRFLALGPTANWAPKIWPAERFAELARRLTAPGAALADAPIVVLGGAAERALAEPLLRLLPADRTVDLVGRAELPVAGALLRRAALFVGNDSGLMHLAAAAGAPTLGLFGPSPAVRYAPWGPRAAVATTEVPYERLVGSPGFDHRASAGLMDSLPVDTAEAAALRLLARVG
ncbi:MAG: glycosyltransferase family 9 protein [Thalassobaculales bacterium]